MRENKKLMNCKECRIWGMRTPLILTCLRLSNKSKSEIITNNRIIIKVRIKYLNNLLPSNKRLAQKIILRAC